MRVVSRLCGNNVFLQRDVELVELATQAEQRKPHTVAFHTYYIPTYLGQLLRYAAVAESQAHRPFLIGIQFAAPRPHINDGSCSPTRNLGMLPSLPRCMCPVGFELLLLVLLPCPRWEGLI